MINQIRRLCDIYSNMKHRDNLTPVEFHFG